MLRRDEQFFFAKIHPASIKKNLLKPVQILKFAITFNNQRVKARMNECLPRYSNKKMYQTYMRNNELKLKAINQVYIILSAKSMAEWRLGTNEIFFKDLFCRKS